MRTLLKATSWMDWWFYTAKFMVMHNTSKNAKVQRLFVAGVMTQLIKKAVTLDKKQ